MKQLNIPITFFVLLCLLVFTVGFIGGFWVLNVPQPTHPKIGAYIRLKNEMRTLPAVLASIDGMFDKIVIIHSNEPDDGSNAYAKAWCKTRSICQIYEYPHVVIPSHDIRYRKKNFRIENSLAAYYQFGLNKFDPEDWVMKIDADQIYIRPRLEGFLNHVHSAPHNENILYNVHGYNTLVWNNRLVKLKGRPLNGLMADHFIVKRKNIDEFSQERDWELIHYTLQLNNIRWPEPIWFHFMKSIKETGESARNNETLSTDEVLFLSPDERDLYQKHIDPLFDKNSLYGQINY